MPISTQYCFVIRPLNWQLGDYAYRTMLWSNTKVLFVPRINKQINALPFNQPTNQQTHTSSLVEVNKYSKLDIRNSPERNACRKCTLDYYGFVYYKFLYKFLSQWHIIWYLINNKLFFTSEQQYDILYMCYNAVLLNINAQFVIIAQSY